METSSFLIFLIMGVFMTAMGVMTLSFSFGMVVREQKRHNEAMELILAEIRDRQAGFVP